MVDTPIRTTEPRQQLSKRATIILALTQGLLPTMTAVVGGLWVLFTYVDHQHEIERDAAAHAKQELQARWVEARRPFLERQFQAYLDATMLVGRIQNSNIDKPDWRTYIDSLWRLSFGELTLVGDARVVAMTQHFLSEVDKYEQTLRDHEPEQDKEAFDLFRAQARRGMTVARQELVLTLRKAIEKSWETSIEPVEK